MENLADEWEQRAVIRARFRREISWLQFPCTGNKNDPHAPTTRALELNIEVLTPMLSYCSFEFLDIDRLQRQAGSL